MSNGCGEAIYPPKGIYECDGMGKPPSVQYFFLKEVPMAKYRKKPVVIEAFQMTEARRNSNHDWPGWAHLAWNRSHGEGGLWPDPDSKGETLVCGTLEGVARVDPDDWIIKGIKNEIYPCKPDIFEATYEAV